MDKAFKTLIEYHCSLNQRVCDSIALIENEHFIQDDVYSRGSIRNLMVHIASTDHRATVLQKLSGLGAPTFDQDFILWMWN